MKGIVVRVLGEHYISRAVYEKSANVCIALVSMLNVIFGDSSR